MEKLCFHLEIFSDIRSLLKDMIYSFDVEDYKTIKRLTKVLLIESKTKKDNSTIFLSGLVTCQNITSMLLMVELA